MAVGTTAVAKGDLAQKITGVGVLGETLDLVDVLNLMDQNLHVLH